MLAVACLFSVTVAGGAAVEKASSADRILLRLQGLPGATDTSAPSLATRQILREFSDTYPQYEIERFVFPELEGMGIRPSVVRIGANMKKTPLQHPYDLTVSESFVNPLGLQSDL